jgi:hypothetical protein
MLWLAVLLHAGIGVLMGLNLFELLMMTMLLAFLQPGVIRDRLKGLGVPKLDYGFDAANEKQVRSAALVAAVDVDNQVNFEPGKKFEQPDASTLFSTLRLLGLFRILLFVPGLSSKLSQWFSPAAAARRTTPKSGPPAPAAAS